MNQWVWNQSHGDHLSWWFGPSRRISIIHEWDLIYAMGKFGTHQSRQKFKIWNFPNSLIPRKFNSGCFRPNQEIGYYWSIFCSRCAKIVKRCILSSFCPYCVIIRTFSRTKVRRSTILAFLSCYKLTLFLWLRILVSPKSKQWCRTICTNSPWM